MSLLVADTPLKMKHMFPYFGGKSLISKHVWKVFGNPSIYCEPFFGSGAMLWDRPDVSRNSIEVVNDMDGFVINFWRAVKHDPSAVASWADYPVFELDMHARNQWMITKRSDTEFVETLRSDPEYYDAKIAGWWVWGQSTFIGSGWASDSNKSRPQISRPSGVHKTSVRGRLDEWMSMFSERLRYVNVLCGSWDRAVQDSIVYSEKGTCVFLDPPYDPAIRDNRCYSVDVNCSHQVRDWAIAHGDSDLKIALCGYDIEHDHYMPATWHRYRWKANGGYGNMGDKRARGNKSKEVVWFSPACRAGDILDDGVLLS